MIEFDISEGPVALEGKLSALGGCTLAGTGEEIRRDSAADISLEFQSF